MAKGNPFLGLARGSAGDFTYYRMNGEQVFRVRNRHPANPQSDLQLLQRVVMLTAQRAYSMLSPLCDHSFQGKKQGTESQSRFTVLNTAMMRDDLADAIESIVIGRDDGWQTSANYSSKDQLLPQYKGFIISEGTIAPLAVEFEGGKSSVPVGSLAVSTSTTYAQLIDALGVRAGDQLTFVQMTIDDDGTDGYFNGMKYARVILMPDDQDLTHEIFTDGPNDLLTIGSTHANPANQGTIYFSPVSMSGFTRLAFTFRNAALPEISGDSETPAAAAVIVSRKTGDVWLRSTSHLVLRPTTQATGNLEWDHETDYLGDAMDSLRTIESGSALYLNQADNG